MTTEINTTEQTTVQRLIDKLGPIITKEFANELLDQEKKEHQLWWNKGFEFYHAQLLIKQNALK